MPSWVRWFAAPLGIALIAAMATVAGPVVADKLMNQSILSFAMIESPAIPTPEGSRRIYSYTVRNAGTVKLTNVRGQIENDPGQFEQVSTVDSKLITPIIQLTPEKTIVRIAASTLLAGDEFAITVMTLNAGDTKPTFTIRSDQVLGIDGTPTEDQKRDAGLSAISLASSIIAFIGTLIALFASRTFYRIRDKD